MEVKGPRETPSPAVRGRVSAPHRAGWSGPPLLHPPAHLQGQHYLSRHPTPPPGHSPGAAYGPAHPLGTCGGEPGHSQHLPGTQGPRGNRPLSSSGGTWRHPGAETQGLESRTARLRGGFGLRGGNGLTFGTLESGTGSQAWAAPVVSRTP